MRDERGSAMAETVVFSALCAALLAATLFLGHRLLARQKLAAASRMAAVRAEIPGGGHRFGPSHGRDRRSVGAVNRYLFATGTQLDESRTTLRHDANQVLGTKVVLQNDAPVPPAARLLVRRDSVSVAASNRVLLSQLR